MPNKVIVQNLYRTTITSAAAIPASGDFQFDVAVAPAQKNGFLILGSENIATRQIVYYHDVVGVTVYVRGINRITAAAIAVPTGYSVKMNDVAEIFNYFGDNISTLFYIEKMGGLSAKVWGGYLMYNNNQVSVADTTLTLTDNTTNYVKYDAPTNTISADTVASGNIKCEVVCSGGAITSILYRTSKESYLDFAISITGALPSQGGNAGKFLGTDGTNVSWQTVIPTQTSNSGKALSTDGTNTVWTNTLNLNVIKGSITTNTDAATITFNKTLNDFHSVILGGNRTLALNNMAIGDRIVINLVQDAAGSRIVTWFTTIKWQQGIVPVLSTGANKGDLFAFWCTASGVYYGMIIGQNF